MNHQPFETWILSDDPLQLEEQELLEEHLKTCEDCRGLLSAMEGIRQTFSAAPSPAPAPGFTQRWHERLAFNRQTRQQRNMWILTLALFSLASILSLTILLLELGQVNWFYYISQFIASISLFAARINRIWIVLSSINKTLPILTPIMIVFGVGLTSAMFALIVTWFSSMFKLYQPLK